MKVGVEPVSDNSGGSSRSKKSVKSRVSTIGSAVLQDDEHENLGDDFEQSAWVPPSIAKALDFKRRSIYRYADGVSVNSIDVIHAADMGAGVTLYFAFARTMAWALFFMSILSIPALIMVYSGTGVLAQDRDALGLYRYTLGNIGVNPANPNYAESIKCIDVRYPVNTTCIHFKFFGDHEQSLSDAGAILTTMEFFQMIIFLVSIWAFTNQILALQEDAARRNTNMSDYSIKVSHIPPNTTAADILAHFNGLYQLEVKDFRKRPALENARPVQNHFHNGDQSLIGTWVAEVVIHKSIGKFIYSFKSKQHITTKLYRARAKMKMYSKNSCHEGGLDSTRYLLAKREMQRQANKIDKLTAMNVRRKGLKLSQSRDDLDELENAPYIHEDIYTSIDAPTVAAFITFEYSESLARCVHDYAKYSRFPMSLFYPRKLKFKGRKIKVVRAPEPDQIIWENLEVTRAQQLYLRMRTNLITVALVVLCFIIILQASIYKQIFSARIPSSALCKQTVPELYTTSTVLTAKSVSAYTLTRPPDPTMAASLDAQCEAAIPGTFYTIYTRNDNFDAPVVPYNISACLNSTTGVTHICPSVSQATYCPCVSITDTTQCSSAECSLGASNPSCITFDASAIGSCYCYEQLSNILESQGVIEALSTITSSKSSDPCFEFYRNYSFSSSITIASIIFASLVNVILKFCIKKLVGHEAHTSLDKEQGSRMSKVFMSNYFTMAVIVLIAYGKIDGLPAILNVGHIFDGQYRDFNQGWYGNVGFYFMTTFILQSFAPLMLGLLKYLVFYPLMRFYHHGRVRKFRSHSIVMQRDLNLLQVGDVFDATTHTAQLLTLLFFAMTFSPGLPLLMPLCCFSFIMYFYVDKILLCRFYQKPSQIGNASIKLVVSYLPYAAVLRFAIAVWMYSCPSIFPADPSTHSSYSLHTSYLQFIHSARVGSYMSTAQDYFRLRVLERNSFPLFVGLVLIVLTLTLRAVWTFLPLYWVYKFVNCVIGCFQTKQTNTYKKYNKKSGTIHPWHLLQLNDPLRQEMAPFTGEYFKYVRVLEYNPDTCCQKLFKKQELTEAEINHGWGLHEAGDFVVRKKCTKSGRVEKTFEVIADSGCHSFNIETVPAYVLAVKGLKEGTNMADGFSRKRPGSAGSRKTGIEMDPDYLADLRAKRGLGTDDYNSDADNSIDANMIMPTEDDEEQPVHSKYNFDVFDEPAEEDEMLVQMRQKYQQRGGPVVLEPINATKKEIQNQNQKQQKPAGPSGKIKKKPQPTR